MRSLKCNNLNRNQMSLKADLILRRRSQDREGHLFVAEAAFVVIVYGIVIEIAGTRTSTEDTIDTQASICLIVMTRIQGRSLIWFVVAPRATFRPSLPTLNALKTLSISQPYLMLTVTRRWRLLHLKTKSAPANASYLSSKEAKIRFPFRLENKAKHWLRKGKKELLSRSTEMWEGRWRSALNAPWPSGWT